MDAWLTSSSAKPAHFDPPDKSSFLRGGFPSFNQPLSYEKMIRHFRDSMSSPIPSRSAHAYSPFSFRPMAAQCGSVTAVGKCQDGDKVKTSRFAGHFGLLPS